MRRGSESEDESVHRTPHVAAVAEDRRNERFGDLTPERRLEQFRAEVEKLSQVIGGSSRDRELTFGRRDRCGSRKARSTRNGALACTAQAGDMADFPVRQPLIDVFRTKSS
ncbi:hypothetical protein HPB52_018101 [Rhipicephalus sanguineus]|uniref:Uncharacterized protein n=1 Tax=Rhipicephalus sanguineus TaxID=34632 RepID=A0A9D4PG26_RHISA|nr:hypothetical protein HPB52_018101 [Rhipicephalus sanguineus]